MTPEELRELSKSIREIRKETKEMKTELSEWERLNREPQTALDGVAYCLGVIIVAAAILFFIFV